MNLNRNQIISIIIAILSVLAGSTAQLTDLFGPGITKTIISVAGLFNTILSSVMVIITSQGGTVRDVLAMPGVEKLDVNGDAGKTLAMMAIDKKQDKIAPTPAAMQQVTETAKGV